MKNKIIFTLGTLLLLGCDTIKVENKKDITTPDTNSSGVNKAPTANAGSDRTVKAGVTINIVGEGRDIDGTIIDYEWYEGTQLISGRQTLEYVTGQDGNHTLKLNVYDDDGTVGSDSMILTVTP